MKKILLIGILSLLIFPVNGYAYTIGDNYWGGDITSSSYSDRDVVGDTWRFDLDSISVEFNGNKMTVVITGDYFSAYNTNQSYVYGMQPGDLFVSSDGWNMGNQSAPYSSDTSTTGEDWEYVVVLSTETDDTGNKIAYLYAVNSANIKESESPSGSGWIYRADQEWKYSASGAALETGSWSIVGDTLVLNIDVSDMSITSSSIGFHYAMQCANDVIEGAAQVPEPSTLLLFGSGLIGLAVFTRLRKT
jgi:hypothetical protein